VTVTVTVMIPTILFGIGMNGSDSLLLSQNGFLDLCFPSWWQIEGNGNG